MKEISIDELASKLHISSDNADEAIVETAAYLMNQPWLSKDNDYVALAKVVLYHHMKPLPKTYDN